MENFRIIFEKTLDKKGLIGYNMTCHCVKSVFQAWKCETLPINLKEVQNDAQNLPTEKASKKKGARLQKENEDCWWQKRTQEKTRKGQKETDLLIVDSFADNSNIKHRLLWSVPCAFALSAFLFVSDISRFNLLKTFQKIQWRKQNFSRGNSQWSTQH